MVSTEYDMDVVKLWSVKSMRESVWCDTCLIGVSGGITVRVKKQYTILLYISTSKIICLF